ncbi:MAG TPA: N-acetyltransferase [Armatimonadetes bacterium]|nr:N-acetyltransferase [Armatimonadota bacterium]
MCEVEIRPCAWRELLTVYRIHQAAFDFPYGFSRFVYYKLFAPRGVLVALRDQKIVGYIIATTAWYWPPHRVGEIVSLATVAHARRTGVASALLTTVLQSYTRAGLREVYLQVAVNNTAALGLYRKFGFRQERRLARYYLDGRDAYLMRCELPFTPPPTIPPAAAAPRCRQLGKPGR